MMDTKILVIEDDASVSDNIKSYFNCKTLNRVDIIEQN